MKSKAAGALIGLLLLLVIYVGAYITLVERGPFELVSLGTPYPWPRSPNYRFGGQFSEMLFLPVQKIDERLRPRYWQWTKQDADDLWQEYTRRRSGWRSRHE